MAMRRTLVLLFGLFGLALLGMRATPVHAQEEVTLQIQPGGAASADPQARAVNTWLDQALQADNHIADADLQVRATPTAVNQNSRAIMQFDISRIPRSGIKSAILHLWVDTAPGVGVNWDIDPITSFISWAQPSRISWSNRTNQLTWAAPGGDFSATPCTITGVTAGANTCDVTSTFMTYFGGSPPSPNDGYIIRDQGEDTVATTETGTIASNSQATIPPGCSPISPPTCVTHAPSLVVDFIQQVHSLTATPGNGQVVLNWTYPSPVANSTIVHATTGVVILRNTNAPVEDRALIQDGTAPPPVDCTTTVNGAASTIVVFNGGTVSPINTFTDNTCGITNLNTYYYKVFAVADLGGGLYNYSQNGNAAAFLAGKADSSFAAEISATPGATPAAQQGPVWIAPVRSAALNAPSIDPGNYAIVASHHSLVQGFNPTTGDDAIAPVSVGGTVGGPAGSRVPVLEAPEEDFGPSNGFGQIPMTYLAAGDDNLVYDVGLENQSLGGALPQPGGFVLDFLNPLGGAGVSGAYVGGVALQAKAFSNSGNTKPNDVMIMGTDVAATPTTNVIFAANTCNLSVAPGNELGCTSITGTGGGWNVAGGAVTSTGCSATALPATCNLDVVTSTPFVDYKNNTVWVTSHNNASASTVVNSPNVWKLDANTGAVLAAINLGGNIDSSPTGTQDQSLIFVGTNAGVLYAFDPTATDTVLPSGPVVPHQVGNPSVSLGNGPIKGFPLVASSSPPWLIVVSTNTLVQILSFNGTSFTSLFTVTPTSTPPGSCDPSSPVTGPGLTNGSGKPIVIIGCSGGTPGGTLHQINLVTGADEAQRIVDPGTTIGDPSLDISTNEVIVGSSDGRVYSFKAPFL
jgi:hypothetical protein